MQRQYDPNEWPIGTRVVVNGYLPDDVVENPNAVLPGKIGAVVAHGIQYLKVKLDVLPGAWYFSGAEVDKL